VFCEPASAASVAGLIKTGLPDGVGPGATVVCVLTGHGLKDPDIAISQISVPTVVDADLGAVLEELSL
jgi:threonine synthase